MDWTFWLGLILIAAIVAAVYWAFSLRRRRDAMRGENRESGAAVSEAREAKRRAKEGPYGGL